MQGGIMVNGKNAKSKAEVKRAMQEQNSSVVFYDTSAFNSQGSMSLANLPDGNHTFVGPDPYTKRNFYGSITKRGDAIKIL